MSNISNKNGEYINFLAEVKERIRHSQYKALKSVNKDIDTALLGYWATTGWKN